MNISQPVSGRPWPARRNSHDASESMDFTEFYPDMRTSVGAACQQDQPDLLLQLIEAGKSVNAADSRGFQPVHVAAMKSLRCLKILLDRDDTNIEAITHDGKTPLLLAASSLPDSRECLHYLLEKGANPDAAGDDGDTALHFAARKACLSAVKWLRRSSKDSKCLLRVGGIRDKTPLEDALSNSRRETSETRLSEVVEYLLKHLQKLKTPLQAGSTKAKKFRVRYSSCDRTLSAAFGLACLRAPESVIRDFLRFYFKETLFQECHFQNYEYQITSPLTLFLLRRTFDLEVAQELLRLGARVNSNNEDAPFLTPLVAAASGGTDNHLTMTETLLPLSKADSILVFRNKGKLKAQKIFDNSYQEVTMFCELPLVHAMCCLRSRAVKLLVEKGGKFGQPCLILDPDNGDDYCPFLTAVSCIFRYPVKIDAKMEEKEAAQELVTILETLVKHGHDVKFDDTNVACPVTYFLTTPCGRGRDHRKDWEIQLYEEEEEEAENQSGKFYFLMGNPEEAIVIQVLRILKRGGAFVDRKSDYRTLVRRAAPVKTALAIKEGLLDPSLVFLCLEDIGPSVPMLAMGNLLVLGLCLPERRREMYDIVQKYLTDNGGRQHPQDFLDFLMAPPSLAELAGMAVRRSLTRKGHRVHEAAQQLELPKDAKDYVNFGFLTSQLVKDWCSRCNFRLNPLKFGESPCGQYDNSTPAESESED